MAAGFVFFEVISRLLLKSALSTALLACSVLASIAIGKSEPAKVHSQGLATPAWLFSPDQTTMLRGRQRLSEQPLHSPLRVLNPEMTQQSQESLLSSPKLSASS